MANYDVFAPFYDDAMGDMTKKISFLCSLINQHAPDAKSILELACGTGTIITELSQDFEVAGLDLSPEMIKVAKQKLPDADIRIADMTKFDFGKSFDIVLCVYDSINHLPEWQDWQATFAKAHEHLNENGLFIFDFNTGKRLEMLASFPEQKTELGNDYMLANITNENGCYHFQEKVFQKLESGSFKVHKEDICEVSFPVSAVRNEASKLFEILSIVDNRGLSEDDPNWRPFFICRKNTV